MTSISRSLRVVLVKQKELAEMDARITVALALALIAVINLFDQKQVINKLEQRIDALEQHQ